MTQRILGSVVLLAVVSAAASASAAEYHVAPGGSDSADGSEGSPWETLQHAADSVAAGDDVVVAAGEYAGFTLTTSGTESAPIRFLGQGRETIVNAAGVGGDGIGLLSSSHVTVLGFVVSGATGAGIRVSAGTGVRIEENRIHGCEGEGIVLEATREARVANNVVWDNGGHGIRLTASAGSPPPAGNGVVNNTVHATAAGAWCVWVEAGGVSGLENNRLLNNVLMADPGGAGAVGFDGDGETGYAGARNALTDRFTTDGGATVVSLVVFQRGGVEMGSLATEPTRLFVGTAESDYRLRAGCPAVNAGLGTFEELTAPDRDILGIPRPVGTSWDMGAYEFCTGWTCTGETPDAGIDAGTDAGGDAGVPGADDGGCGCAVPGEDPGTGWWMWVPAVVVAFGVRRRLRPMVGIRGGRAGWIRLGGRGRGRE